MIKKSLAAALIGSLLLSAVSCGKPAPIDASSQPTAGSETTTALSAPSAADTTADASATEGTTPGGPTGVATKTKTKATKAPTTRPATTPTKEDESKFMMKKSNYIKNDAVWSPPTVTGDGFYFEIQASTLGNFKSIFLRNSIEEYQLGHMDSRLPGVGAEEWGNAFCFLDGLTDGAGQLIDSGYKTPPKDRAESLKVIKAFLDRQFIKGGAHPWKSMTGHFLWQHYAGEWGYDILGSEIGESINSYQLHVAFNRGAARQYHKPWYIDFSAWNHGYITDYSGDSIWGSASGPDNGHSMSLFERAFIMSYMGGASYYIAEAGAAIAFYNKLTADGVYELSPYGETCRKLNAFAANFPDAGTAYTPFGIVLDYYHGTYPGFGAKLAFNFFNYNAGDTMSWNLMNLFFPGSLEIQHQNERGAMVNGPYGDSCDFLLQNASQEVLNSYPCLILSGDVKLSAAEAARYTAYVKQGGTLILNTAYLSAFPAYKKDMGGKKRLDITDGKGKVIVYGGDYQVDALDAIIREQLAKTMPFRVTGDIQYSVSVKNGSLFLTLINNNGVTKAPNQKPVVDASRHSKVTAAYTGNLRIKTVNDIKNSKKIPLSGKQVTLNVGAGETAVLEFKFA